MNAPSIRSVARGVSGLVLLALVAAACSSAATPSPVASAAPSVAAATSAPPASAPAASVAASAASSAPSTAGGTGVVVNMATTSLGPVLTAPSGLSLYTHTGDTATTSSCTGGCATAWPPLAVPTGGAATGGTGVSGTFATLTRADGTIQVTYNGLPLYTWMNDHAAGDVTGQGIAGFSVAKP